MADRLSTEILQHLEKKLRIKAPSIRVQLSILKRKYSGLTLNASAQLYAQKHGISILPKLSATDKESLAKVQITLVPKREVNIPTTQTSQNNKKFLKYETTNIFERKHIDEINGTYFARCYTATYILCRKVMENLIIEILKNKFPTNKDKGLYEDHIKHRFLDFSVVLDNLYKKRGNFTTTAHSAIDRLKQKATPFKKDANNKTHSLFHIATKTEIENAEVQEIFDLIAKIMKEIGL